MRGRQAAPAVRVGACRTRLNTRPPRLAAYGGLACRRRGLDARDTLILAFSRKGRRDLSLAIRTWFRVAGLIATVWIPAFAGMTGDDMSGGATIA